MRSLSGLGNGSHTLTVRVTDKAGNAGLGSTTWTVDATAPVVSLTTPANGGYTNSPTPTIIGSGGLVTGDSATVTVKIYTGAVVTGTALQTLTATKDAVTGIFQVAATTLTAPGTYTMQASQTDSVGNTGLSLIHI